MKQVCHRTLFKATVHQAILICSSGCLLPLPCSSLAGSLDAPSRWRRHNYLFIKILERRGISPIRWKNRPALAGVRGQGRDLTLPLVFSTLFSFPLSVVAFCRFSLR